MKIIHYIINFFIIFCVIAIGFSFFMKKHLPPQNEIQATLKLEPKQTETSHEKFTFSYRGTDYEVQPKADYELWGLVVSHNNINKFGDIYHNEDSVDLKDICVIWGDNLLNGSYLDGKYKSGSWTCYWEFNDQDAWIKFKESQISNNHLIASDESIQDQIRGLRVGDQVHVKGYLVDYSNKETGWKRETSLTRQDTGNHACEVIFVNKLEILKPGNVLWYQLYYWGKWGLLGFIILKIILMFYSSHRDIRKMDEKLTKAKQA